MTSNTTIQDKRGVSIDSFEQSDIESKLKKTIQENVILSKVSEEE